MGSKIAQRPTILFLQLTAQSKADDGNALIACAYFFGAEMSCGLAM